MLSFCWSVTEMLVGCRGRPAARPWPFRFPYNRCQDNILLALWLEDVTQTAITQANYYPDLIYDVAAAAYTAAATLGNTLMTFATFASAARRGR